MRLGAEENLVWGVGAERSACTFVVFCFLFCFLLLIFCSLGSWISAICKSSTHSVYDLVNGREEEGIFLRKSKRKKT